MKTFLKVILLLILIGISIGLLLIGKGYDMYKEAIHVECVSVLHRKSLEK